MNLERNRRILVVDDDDGMRSELFRTLEGNGFEVILGSDCRTGLDLFEQGEFDLVLLDLKMPDFEGMMADNGGILLLEKIRSHVGDAELIPIWVLTATVSQETRDAAYLNGAIKYLDKADFYLQRQAFLQEIEQATGNGRAKRAARPASEDGRQGDSSAKDRQGTTELDQPEEASRQDVEGGGSQGRQPDPQQDSEGLADLPPTSRGGEPQLIEGAEPVPRTALPNRSVELEVRVVDSSKLQATDHEILSKLYRDCSVIELSAFSAKLTKARVFKVDGTDLKGNRLTPFVTKMGDADQIAREYGNFKKYVQYQLSGARYSEIKDVCYSDDRKHGGIRMAFVGSDLAGATDLKTFIMTREPEEIETAMDHLFGHTFCRWHRGKSPAAPLDLVAAYDYFGGSNKIRGAMKRFFKGTFGQQLLEFDLCAHPFYEPANALDLLVKRHGDRQVDAHLSTIHGDLNVTNVLVDGSAECWLLDFAATATGPILKDFVELEASVKYGCYDGPVEDLWYLEKALMRQDHFRQKVTLLHSDPALLRVFAAVRKIREYAYLANAPERDMTEYYMGLLYYTLGMVRFNNKILSREKKECLLLAAALLFDKFKQPGDAMGFVDASRGEHRIRHQDSKQVFEVLVVDDDKHQRKNLAAMLQQSGRFHGVTAEDSRAAKELLDDDTHSFDLCVTDMEMPGLDGEFSPVAGLDLLRYLRVKHPLLPTVVLSATTDVQVAVDSIARYGAVEFVGKAEMVKDSAGFLSKIEDFISEAAKSAHETLEQERIVELIQSALPDRLPSLDAVDIALYCESLEKVGGDLYDFGASGNQELRLMIGDVKGHGLPAAILMSQLYSFYQDAGLPSAGELGGCLGRWNDFVLGKKIASEILPLCLASLDIQSKVLHFANAGHNPPFIVDPEGTIESLEAAAPPLGVVSGIEYPAEKRALSDGAVLVLYTDGIPEARNTRREEFGLQRLQECVRSARASTAAEIKDHVIEEMQRFIAPREVHDDVTLIVLRLVDEKGSGT